MMCILTKDEGEILEAANLGGGKFWAKEIVETENIEACYNFKKNSLFLHLAN